MKEELTVAEASELSGLTPNQVSRYIYFRMIMPEVKEAEGIGYQSILSPKNIRELKLIAKLKQAGIKNETIKSVLKTVNNSSLDWWKEGGNYVAALKDSWLITDNPFSQSNKDLFAKEGIILLVEL